ncbi:thiamine pyrophosphokinase [Streptococcus equi subsp. zooepidemicus MGCS10565]|uniref:Thiamine diphosphokinase n=1 Tax=Streptococcus equi subsp. zooepidemicus (strain MGCS10565) TaxID=552526 RepID=B4U0V2_STREM|nr:thiamine diphosphokinase [Streptococcus equi]ACG61639.1 thiamine pyrophosphokinase [Streptococcus equi subsp. zooepidemicus MGCS10565]MDI6035393.1 thiamine diphosphokinase [Streptococcus equi subsp. zooepidemicus]QZA21310.1 thiamine diphosphokinase [Streptococcus equi subsp. zooepidemicus]SQF53363.1 thiamin pyrophosphokinase [Streptococcus equi subsp. zooepidemicus]HEL0657281.1 thiamine diphosphokinase [Streptococcus equi subsp. zooepidemicus]
MVKVALFAGGDLSYFTCDFDYFVGIDRGSLFLLENGLPLNMAVGDFDSIPQVAFEVVKEQAELLVQASPEKNDTDTELALKEVFTRFPEAEVTIFGAFGGRLDHLLSNVFLPADPELAPFMAQICLRDQQNAISYRSSGWQTIRQDKDMTYVAFMADGDVDLTITGAKFDLTTSNFFKKKVYASNEFIDQPIKVHVPKGYLIIIQSKDRS